MPNSGSPVRAVEARTACPSWLPAPPRGPSDRRVAGRSIPVAPACRSPTHRDARADAPTRRRRSRRSTQRSSSRDGCRRCVHRRRNPGWQSPPARTADRAPRRATAPTTRRGAGDFRGFVGPLRVHRVVRRARNRIPRPHQRTGACVECADDAEFVVDGAVVAHGGAGDDEVVPHRWRRRDQIVAGVARPAALVQIDEALLPKSAHAQSGFRIERDEARIERAEQDAQRARARRPRRRDRARRSRRATCSRRMHGRSEGARRIATPLRRSRP